MKKTKEQIIEKQKHSQLSSKAQTLNNGSMYVRAQTYDMTSMITIN